MNREDWLTTVGADPEVYCWPACWRRHSRVFTTPSGNFGADGAGFPTGEFRPGPSADPEVVVDNLRRLMRSFARSSYRQFRPVIALATPIIGRRAIGAHIHIGLPPRQRTSHNCIAIASALAVIAGPIIHLIEPPIWSALRRIETTYGWWLDYRHQPHGMEWRYPSFWIAHPQLALGALSLAQTIAECALRLSTRTIGALYRRALTRPGAWNVDFSDYALRMGKRLTTRVGLREEFDAAVNILLSAPRVHPFANILLNWVNPPEIVIDFKELSRRQKMLAREQMASVCSKAGAPVGILYRHPEPVGHNLIVPGGKSDGIRYDGVVAAGIPPDQLELLEELTPTVDMSIISPFLIGHRRE